MPHFSIGTATNHVCSVVKSVVMAHCVDRGSLASHRLLIPVSLTVAALCCCLLVSVSYNIA
jgi:hypothetical protein